MERGTSGELHSTDECIRQKMPPSICIFSLSMGHQILSLQKQLSQQHAIDHRNHIGLKPVTIPHVTAIAFKSHMRWLFWSNKGLNDGLIPINLFKNGNFEFFPAVFKQLIDFSQFFLPFLSLRRLLLPESYYRHLLLAKMMSVYSTRLNTFSIQDSCDNKRPIKWPDPHHHALSDQTDSEEDDDQGYTAAVASEVR